MELDMHIKGALANLPGTHLGEASFLGELERRGLSGADARLALDKAVLEGWVARSADGGLQKLERALTEAVPGNLANTRDTA